MIRQRPRAVDEIEAEITQTERRLAELRLELQKARVLNEIRKRSQQSKRDALKRVFARLESGEDITEVNGCRYWWGDETEPIRERASADEVDALRELVAAGVVEKSQ